MSKHIDTRRRLQDSVADIHGTLFGYRFTREECAISNNQRRYVHKCEGAALKAWCLDLRLPGLMLHRAAEAVKSFKRTDNYTFSIIRALCGRRVFR